MPKPEPVTREIVATFDETRARVTLARLEETLSSWTRSTVDLADAAHQARRDECWRVDEKFLDAQAAGAVAPADHWHISRQWLGWKFNRSARTIRDLADYGELRAILNADPTVPVLAEPEFAARPIVAKLLHPRYLASEERANAGRRAEDVVEEHHDAVRFIWTRAVAKADGIPADAVRQVRDVCLTENPFAPLRRVWTKSTAQKIEDRHRAIRDTAKAFKDAGYLLLRYGATQEFDDAVAELGEARQR